MALRRVIGVCLCLNLCCGQAQALELPSFDGPQALQSLEDEERRVWSQSHDLEVAMEKSGQVYKSMELESYLQTVMDNLYPELAGFIKIHVIRSPVLNAFAIPSGHVYINTGLLARFENEAQLATVLAHEGAHFVNRHGYRQASTVKSASAFAVVTATLGVPIVGLLGQVIALSSMFGYSRELETEADNVGYSRLISAGYDVKEAPKVFEYLAKEVQLSGVEEPFFYSTHPKLKDRVENFVRLGKDQLEGGHVRQEEYAKQINTVRLEDLDMELSFGRFKHLIALLEDDSVRSRYPGTSHYYLGEAYRKRNDAGDDEQADKSYDKALELAPDFAPTYRAKALLCMKQAKKEEAEKLFVRYLDMVPDAKDRPYVEEYLQSLKTNQ